MKLKGSIFVLFLTVLLSLSLSATAFAELPSGSLGSSNLTYQIGADQTLTIGGSGEMPDYGTTDMPWASYSSSIFNIVINEGVTSIGDNAFVNIQADEITIPDSVVDIGSYAIGYSHDGNEYSKIPGFKITAASGSVAQFYAENNGFEFKSTTPASLEGTCGNGVSYKLTVDGILTISGEGEIYSYPAGNTPWSNYISGTGDYIIKEVRILNGVTGIGTRAFYGCSSLTTVTLPESLTTISDRAFANCMALTTVNMTDYVAQIGEEAFSYCTSLKSITLGKALESIGNKAFSQSGLTEINLPISLSSTGETIFYGCTDLKEATINCETVPPRVFAECSSLTTVILTETVTSIGESAFEGCVSLSTVSGTDALTSVGPYAFDGCTALVNTEFAQTVNEFGYYCFKGCTGLDSFIFNDTVTVVPEGMFYGCTSLSEITLGDSIEKIGNYAFVDCRNLTSILISYKIRHIGLNALGYSYTENGYVPMAGVELEIKGFTPSIAKLYAEEHNITFVPYKTVDTDIGNLTETIVWKFRPSTGVLNIIGTGTMPSFLSFDETPWYVYASYIKQVTVSNGVLNIGSCSFQGCSTIEKFDIPGTVEIIESYAFAGTSIITANIPNGVKEIANNAFEGCPSLYKVSLPNTLERIGEAAFRGPNIMTSVFIPESVTEIGANAVGFNGDNSIINGFKIKGIDGSIASSYAKQNRIDFMENGYIEITDSSNNCQVSILGDSQFGYKLEFNKLESVFTPELIIPSDQAILLYEIILNHNDNPARFDGSAEISFTIPEGMTNKLLYVYAVDSNGDFISMTFTNSDGRISFSNSTLGKYVITTVDLTNLYNITINYLYSDGTTAKDSVIVRATSGAQYRFTAENITGCTPNEYAFSGVVANEDITIEFIYTKNASGNNSPGGKGNGSGTGTKVLITVLLVILIIALIAAIIILIYLNNKKKKQQQETGRTISAAKKKPQMPDEMAKTIIIPDFETREINIESLFADDPEEDLDAEENLRKKK